MINSIPYKNDLQKEVVEVKKLFIKNHYISSNRRFFKVEKFLFTSAFLIRKLIEGKKISDELEKQSFKVKFSIAKDINLVKDHIDKWDYWENYQTEIKEEHSVSLYEITNLFIHSHILLFFYNASKQKDNTEKIEIAVTSDWEVDKIFYLSLKDYLSICLLVCKDRIVSASYGYKRGQDFMTILSKSRNHFYKKILSNIK